MSTAAPDIRARELAQIHIAKKQLGLDDDTYRAMLWTVARVRSAKDLDFAGRKKVLEHLRSRGFKPGAPKRARVGRPHNMNGGDRAPQLSKVAALLADAGRAWAYADSMAKHMFKVDRVAFCDGEQLQKLIAALVYDQKRRTQRAT